MSKPASDHLFRLIHSLTRNEKGYIKKMACRNGEKSTLFIRLFDTIDRQQEYDETVLQRHPEFGRNLPRLKHYLYERLLSLLDQYHAIGSANMQLHHLLNHVEVLYRKGMYERCFVLLGRAGALCSKYENLLTWLNVLAWERRLSTEQMLFSRREKAHREEEYVLGLLQNYYAYKNTYDRISVLYATVFVVRSEEEHKKFLELLENPLTSSLDQAYTFHAKIMHLKTRAKYLASIDDRESYLRVSQLAVSLYEQHPHFIQQDVHGYIRVLNNLLATLAEHKLYAAFDASIRKLHVLPLRPGVKDSGNLEVLIHIRVTLRKFYRHFAAAELERALGLVPEIEHLLILHEDVLGYPHRQIFCYSIACLLFITGDKERALVRTEQLLRSEAHAETATYIALTRLLHLFIHYDAGHTDLVEYLAASARSFFIRHHKYYAVEKIAVRYLGKKLPAAGSSAEYRQLLLEMKSELLAANDPILNRSYEYFDPVAWIDARLSNRPLAAAYKERIFRAYAFRESESGAA